MLDGVAIEPMSEAFLVWRCLHDGPLTTETIEQLPENYGDVLRRCRTVNVPLMKKLMSVYGTCAIIATDGDAVVGTLRFYPKAMFGTWGAGGGFCLQAGGPPNGPSEETVQKDMPVVEDLADKTLRVHCMMTGSPKVSENPYQRKGIGSAMVRELIRWARSNGWQAIEAVAYEDLPMVYAMFGAAGRRFWEKLGFSIVEKEVAEELAGEGLKTLCKQAVAAGLSVDDAPNRYTMRLELDGRNRRDI